MQLSAGKLWSLRRLADVGGRFKMTAVDQRPPIMQLIRDKKAVDQATDGDVATVKALLTRCLAPEASAMLLDPIWAYPQSIQHVDPRQGLLLTLEDHTFAEAPDGGRRSAAIADWSVAKIKRLGADGVKVLAWYRPDADPGVCEDQQRFVAAVGEACARHDICFLLELLVYPLAGDQDPTRDYRETQAKRPALVLESLRTFADPRFAVDLYKLESPLPATQVPDPQGPEAGACQHWFDQLGRIANRPWVMLSAGADARAFRHILQYAYRAGASGYLAGRAIWWEAMQAFPQLDAVEAKLNNQARVYMREINQLTDQAALPWYEHGCFADGVELAHAGSCFATAYGAGSAD